MTDNESPDLCKICGQEISLTDLHAYDREKEGPVHIACNHSQGELHMPTSYELTTIMDIFEKVPADRIADCLFELGQVLTQSKHMKNAMDIAGQEIGGEPCTVEMIMQMPLVWTDDGTGVCQSNFHMDGVGQVASIKTLLKGRPCNPPTCAHGETMTQGCEPCGRGRCVA